MSLTSINVNNTLVTSVDSEPTAGSDNLVKSGGVANKLTELEQKTSDISKEVIETEDESIDIEDNDGNNVLHLDENGLDAKNVRSNGKDVLTEHQDISGLATKKEVEKKQDVIPQISQEETTSSKEEQIFASDDYNDKSGTGERYASIGKYGVKAKAYLDINGNPIKADGDNSDAASFPISYILRKLGLIGDWWFEKPSQDITLDSNEFIDGVLSKVNPFNKSFIFFTDCHWIYNEHKVELEIARYIKDKLGISKVVFGGDVIGKSFVSAADALLQSKVYMNAAVGMFSKDYVFTLGNHDANTPADSSWTDEQKNTLTIHNKDLQPIYFNHLAKYAVYDDRMIEKVNELYADNALYDDVLSYFKLYYYLDDKKNKIRFIVTNTGAVNHPSFEELFGRVRQGFCLLFQYQFIYNAIKSVPKGYSIVVSGHYFVNWADGNLGTSIIPFARMLSAAKIKGVYRYTPNYDQMNVAEVSKIIPNEEMVFDFSTIANIDKIICVCGDSHFDASVISHTKNGTFINEPYYDSVEQGEDSILWINTQCTCNQAEKTGIGNSYAADPIKNSTQETAIDIISWDSARVYATRVGIGNNRIFNYK